MKKNLFYLSILIGAFVVLGTSLASANGWKGMGGFGMMFNQDPEEMAQMHEEMFENHAEILGVSQDVVKEAWADGKTLKEIAEEQGITDEALEQRMRDQRTEQMRTQLQSLVDEGVITQSQADRRIEVMEDVIENGKLGKAFRKGGFAGMGGCF